MPFQPFVTVSEPAFPVLVPMGQPHRISRFQYGLKLVYNAASTVKMAAGQCVTHPVLQKIASIPVIKKNITNPLQEVGRGKKAEKVKGALKLVGEVMEEIMNPQLALERFEFESGEILEERKLKLPRPGSWSSDDGGALIQDGVLKTISKIESALQGEKDRKHKQHSSPFLLVDLDDGDENIESERLSTKTMDANNKDIMFRDEDLLSNNDWTLSANFKVVYPVENDESSQKDSDESTTAAVKIEGDVKNRKVSVFLTLNGDSIMKLKDMEFRPNYFYLLLLDYLARVPTNTVVEYSNQCSDSRGAL